jgi:hypothetical protein
MMRTVSSLLVLFAPAWAIACSSGGGGGPGGGGSGNQVACVITVDGGALEGCTILEDLNAQAQTEATTNCKGTVATTCPTAGLVGCCKIPSAGAGSVPSEQCWYVGTASTYTSVCSSLNGTWSTSQ